MLGYTAEEAVGRRIEMLDQDEAAAEIRDTVRRVPSGRRNNVAQILAASACVEE